MPSVHYKFKSSLEYKTLVFEGIQISVGELKKLIYENEKIGKTGDFDIQITNAQTKQVYEDESALVQRNTSVIVARVPPSVQQKLPKVWDTRNEGKVIRAQTVSQSSRSVASMLPEKNDLATKSGLSEEEKLKLMQQEATQDYDPSQYKRGRSLVSSGKVPATLPCNRCGQTGHWTKECPLLNIRRPTGIPKDELMETTPDDPQAMLTQSGRYVVSIMDKQAHLIGKKERIPFVDEGTPVMEPEPKREIPTELMCSLCKDLLREAVVIPCCGYSFCDECIRNQLLESDYHECPHCREKGISPDTLVPNSYVRKAVNNFRNETGYVYSKRQRPDTITGTSGHQATSSGSTKLKINLAAAGIARANAAEQKLRTGIHQGSPNQMSTQSPDTRDHESPVVASEPVSTSYTAAATTVSSSPSRTQFHQRPTTHTKSSFTTPYSMAPTSTPVSWPAVSASSAIINATPINVPPLQPLPMQTMPAPSVSFATIFHLQPVISRSVVPPIMAHYPTPQQSLALPTPPGIVSATPPVAYQAQVPPFMATQPPPPGVPALAGVATATPVITSGFGLSRGTTFIPPRRPMTETEFYETKRKLLESRVRERYREPPKDAWEEFLAHKDKKRRRRSSSSRSSRTSSRSRSRSVGRSRRSRSRSVTRSRSRSRSPSYDSRHRQRRDRSRHRHRSRSRSHSHARRSSPPRQRHTSRSPYHRRQHRSRSPSRNRRSKNRARPSMRTSAKENQTVQAVAKEKSTSKDEKSLSKDETIVVPAKQKSKSKEEKSRSKDKKSVSPGEKSPRDEKSISKVDLILEDQKSMLKEAQPTKPPNQPTAEVEKSVHEDEKLPKDQKSMVEDEKSILDDEKSISKEEKSVSMDEKSMLNVENSISTDETSLANDEKSISKDEATDNLAKEKSVSNEAAVQTGEKEEKKKKSKKGKKKKRKHHHKSSKKKRGDNGKEEDQKVERSPGSDSKSKSEKGDLEKSGKSEKHEKEGKSDRKKREKSEKKKSAKDKGESEKNEKLDDKLSGDQKVEKKEKRHKETHAKKERKKSDYVDEPPLKKKRKT